MKRLPREEGAHDSKVRQAAKRLKEEGWNVRADLTGYEKPKSIGKYRNVPDIVATKRGHRRLIEVETPSTLSRDRKQLGTFRRHAAQKPNTTFEIIVTD